MKKERESLCHSEGLLLGSYVLIKKNFIKAVFSARYKSSVDLRNKTSLKNKKSYSISSNYLHPIIWQRTPIYNYDTIIPPNT